MAELLLELLSEEIPARMQDRAREDLARHLGELLAAAGIGFEAPIRSFATPRRLTLVADGLPRRQADRVVERKGPRADAPEAAKAGFLRGLAGLDHRIEEREEKKGRALFAVIREPGRPVLELLAELVPEAAQRLSWPKSMRWGAGEFRWVRPLHGILCLLDGEVVPFALGGVEAGNVTRGHRFMAPGPIPVRDFADYVVRLRAAKVILDGAERRAIIARVAAELAAAEGDAVEDDPALLDEIKGLVEWPVPLLGRIDQDFMEVPPEVLVGTMRQNQKYLALRTPDGALAPRFVVVANLEAKDGGAAIVAGNERVLRARLWDARFFWEQDKKILLQERLPELANVVFHAKLGSLLEKVSRLQWLAEELTSYVPRADRQLAIRAAELAKVDLKTGLVGEFPELQGIIGGHCARHQGEAEAVARAIAEHYAPKGSEDKCPTEPVSVVVALADKIDTLAGFFAAGIMPTGSGDPFALRRAALGVIRIVLENQLRLPLRKAIKRAFQGSGYRERFTSAQQDKTVSALLAFLADRLKVHLREQGVRHDLIAAVLAAGEDDDLVRLLARVEALRSFLDTEDGRNLLVAYRRASGILAVEEKKDGRRYHGHPVPGAFAEPAEEALHAALVAAQERIGQALAAEDFAGAMQALAALRPPLDRFFETVMVNAAEPDLRVNRLLLLSQIRAGLERVADFSLIEEGGGARG